MSWSNWAGNVTASPERIVWPTTTAQVQSIVARHSRVKAVGAGHSFTSIAATDGVLLRLDRMNRVIGRSGDRVRVQAGISLHDLNPRLLAMGLALPNLGDVDPQSVAGATSTGTHGTGARLHGIAAAVSALQIVTASGDVLEIDEHHPWFDAARVGLGALGIVTEIEFACVPAFLLHAREEPMPLGQVLEQLDDLVEGNDHFEFYFFPHTDRALVKRNNRVPDDTARAPLSRFRHWLDDEFLSNTVYERVQRLTTRRPGLVERVNDVSGRLLGAREYTDWSHEVFVSPRDVRFRESEFAMPRGSAREVIGALRDLHARSPRPVSFPVEVRFTAADDVWLSTGHERDNVYVAVHQYHRVDPTEHFAAAQEIFTAHEGRPHWGKMHTLGAEYFAQRYDRFGDFLAVRDELDPQRRFANDYLRRVLG